MKKLSFISSVVTVLTAILLAPLGLSARHAELSEKQIQTMKSSSSLFFTENKGQIANQHGKPRTDIQYTVGVQGMNLFIGKGQIHYQWNTPITGKTKLPEDNKMPSPEDRFKVMETIHDMQMIAYRMDVTLVGADKNAAVIAEGMQPYAEHYYLPTTPNGIDVKSYGKITYKNVYPQIDWVLYTQNNQLKYDFIVHPGGDVKKIQLKYGGATNLSVKEGALLATTPYGTITEKAPFCYNAETKEEVTSHFVLEGNVLKFDIAPHTGTLVVDPTLDWCTYYGGSSYDWGNAATADYSGNIFLSGWTYSTSNIATSGAYQDTLTPHNFSGYHYNGFLVKFNALGQRLWATFYPSGFAAAACDVNSNVYLTGYTDSITAMATTGAHQTQYGGGTGTGYYWGDAFVVKFNQNGVRQWGTFLGGSGYEDGSGIACDLNSNVYVCGGTSSPNNIATLGAHLTTVTVPPYINWYYYQSGFLVKFNTNGVRQWGTYYPGHVDAVDLDQSNNVYIGGTTFDTARNLIATPNAHQTYHFNVLSGNYSYPDGFIAKFNTTGQRSWGTYIGGPSWDWISGLQCDGGREVYVGGTSYSSSGYIASPVAYQTTNQGAYDCFLTKFDSTGVQRWGTFYGGANYEWGGALTWNPVGKIYMGGTTLSPTNIATPGAYQTVLGGSYDQFLVEFDTAGTRKWASYYGGPGLEYGWGGYGWGGYGSGDIVAYSLTGKLYLCSATSSATGIATPGAYQTTLNTTNYYDAFLAAFIVDTLPYLRLPIFDTLFCQGDSFKVKYGVTFKFNTPNTFSIQLSNASGSFASPTIIGTKLSDTADTIACRIPMNITPGNGYRIRVVSSNPARSSGDNAINIRIKQSPVVVVSNNGYLCIGDTLRLTTVSNPATGSYTYNWTGPLGFTSAIANPTVNSPTTSHSGDYILTATLNGCSGKDTTTVQVRPKPAIPTANSNSPVCPGTTLNLTSTCATPGVTYTWSGPSYTSSAQNPTISPVTYAHTGDYTVVAGLNGCYSAANTYVVVAITTPKPTATSNTPVCSGGALRLYASNVSGATYNWGGPAAFTSTNQNPVINSSTLGMAGKYGVTATVNGCVSEPDSVTVVVNNGPLVNIYANPNDSICTGKPVTFVALSINGGNSPQFQWMKNNSTIPGAISASYAASGVVDGDQFRCILTNGTTCATTTSDTSSNITMSVLPYLAPSVSITANPTTPLAPYQLITFTATAVNAGTAPTYQWKINGKDVQGATSFTWGTYYVNNNDTVSVTVTSSYLCPQPAEAVSNRIGVTVLTSVNAINGLSGINLYPNPNNGSFNLSGTIKSGNELSIEVLNAIGQIVYTENVPVINNSLSKQVNLTGMANGVYILRLKSGGESRIMRFTLEQ